MATHAAGPRGEKTLNQPPGKGATGRETAKADQVEVVAPDTLMGGRKAS